ncbi:unnamed protein product [Rotaria sordida]|uniref:Uncharacterized protein n=2 Tax=Rotaria sordida TaxID=392033 RepID=A0A815AVN9_9BILA|nr:unnamed protein product [Rotaria sordida]
MSNSPGIYSNRVLQQTLNREKRKINYQHVISSDSDSDSNSTIHQHHDNENDLTDNKGPIATHHLTDKFLEENYVPDNYDSIDSDTGNSIPYDSSPPLYEYATITTNEAVNCLMQFFIKSNFDKNKVIKMMRLIKSILPSPNKLPTTFRQILRTYGKIPSSIEKFYCNNCFTLTTRKNGQHYCNNTSCRFRSSQLSKKEVTEIVIVNVREKLQSIIKRNFSLFTGSEKLFPSFDIPSGERYGIITKETVHPITLVIHADGAPLIRSTKSALWPCFSAIVELPPPVREYQSNILTLGLWVSAIKPNVNLFLEGIIEQLSDLSNHGTSIFVHEHEFTINVKTQYFVSDLPAKSLFMKTINFNGRVLYNKQVIYPYASNNYRPRTHDEFIITANQVEQNLTVGGKRCTSIRGIKGLSSLLKIFHYPVDIIYDYMHLVCLNHVPTLMKRFTEIISKDAVAEIDSILKRIKIPHEVNVKFIFSIKSVQDWKAKHVRLFILNLGLPIMTQYLPISYASHFSIYCLFIKILHCPKSLEEIQLADKLIHYYCKTSSSIYDKKIELYSLHAHLHLPAQVRNHGGLAFTSSFCFESMINFIKKKAFGTKNLGSQMMYWCDIDSIIPTAEYKLQLPSLVNEIKFDSYLFITYHDLFTKQVANLQQDLNKIKLYLRFKDNFSTYHSFLYSKHFSCASYLVSYTGNNERIEYAKIIVFYLYENIRYSFVQQYQRAAIKLSDYLDIPDELKETVDLSYPICILSDDFVAIPVSEIPSSPGYVLHQAASSCTRKNDSLNHERGLNICAQDITTSDDDLSFLHDVSEEVSSEEELDVTVKSSWNPKTSATRGIKSKKGLVKQKETSTPKRLHLSTNYDDNLHDVHLNLQQIFDYVKQINSNVLKLQKHQQQTTINLDRLEKFLNTLCNNQKKIAKSLVKHKIPITLENDNRGVETDGEQSGNQDVTFVRDDGSVVELLSVPGNRQNSIKYALKLIDVLFTDIQDFQNINVKKADEDPRIKSIYTAVKRKFDYSADEMSFVWPPIHDSILSKRRNQQKKLKTSSDTNEPSKYSIVESKRLIGIDEHGYGTIKELGKSYGVHVEQTGTQEAIERYGHMLEKALQSRMHEDIPSDCEEWMLKNEKENRGKHSTTATISSSKSPLNQQLSCEYRRSFFK